MPDALQSDHEVEGFVPVALPASELIGEHDAFFPGLCRWFALPGLEPTGPGLFSISSYEERIGRFLV